MKSKTDSEKLMIVMINDCRQYSEDAWENCPRIKTITHETTVRELIEWQRNEYPVIDFFNKTPDILPELKQMIIKEIE